MGPSIGSPIFGGLGLNILIRAQAWARLFEKGPENWSFYRVKIKGSGSTFPEGPKVERGSSSTFIVRARPGLVFLGLDPSLSFLVVCWWCSYENHEMHFGAPNMCIIGWGWFFKGLFHLQIIEIRDFFFRSYISIILLRAWSLIFEKIMLKGRIHLPLCKTFMDETWWSCVLQVSPKLDEKQKSFINSPFNGCVQGFIW